MKVELTDEQVIEAVQEYKSDAESLFVLVDNCSSNYDEMREIAERIYEAMPPHEQNNLLQYINDSRQ